ncbi:MAG: STAS domain-containing protein, partial [Paracoccaceae bacterium]
MISTSHTNGVLLLTVTEDRIDLASADRLKTDLLRAFEQSKQAFAVAMANVRCVESAGLGAVVSVYRAVTAT